MDRFEKQKQEKEHRREIKTKLPVSSTCSRKELYTPLKSVEMVRGRKKPPANIKGHRAATP